MATYSLLQRRDVMEILSTRFGKSMIFTVFAMAKEEISSSKTCMITISPLKSNIDDQISEMLSLSCKAMDLMTETVNTASCKQHLKSRAQRQYIHGQRNYKPRLLGLQLSRSRHFSRKRPKKLKYLFSRNKKLQALRVVKEISTLQLHLRSTNSNQRK